MRRWVWWAVLVLLAALAFVSLQRSTAPPAADEIDDASKDALREILQQEAE